MSNAPAPSDFFFNRERTEPFYLEEGEEIVNVKDNGDGTAVLLIKAPNITSPFDVWTKEAAK